MREMNSQARLQEHGDNGGSRDWKDLAEAARQEQDPQRLLDLISQLNQALQERRRAMQG